YRMDIRQSPLKMEKYNFVSAFMEVSDYPRYECQHYFAMIDEKEFVKGYGKMLDLEIDGVTRVADCVGRIFRRNEISERDVSLSEKSSNCEAYWYPISN